MTANNAAFVIVEAVSKTYGEHQFNALVNVSLSVGKGSFVALMGPSGCGKSTLLNLIAGIDKPNGGNIFLDGVNLNRQSDEQLTQMRAGKIGFVFQFFNLLNTLTVKENITLSLDLSHKKKADEKRALVKQMLERVGIAHKEQYYPYQLSGGEMQRVAIARALIHSPQLLLADEPTGNLDSENGKSVLALLREINSDLKTTIIMATHSTEAAQSARVIVEMKDGAIVGILTNAN